MPQNGIPSFLPLSFPSLTPSHNHNAGAEVNEGVGLGKDYKLCRSSDYVRGLVQRPGSTGKIIRRGMAVNLAALREGRELAASHHTFCPGKRYTGRRLLVLKTLWGTVGPDSRNPCRSRDSNNGWQLGGGPNAKWFPGIFFLLPNGSATHSIKVKTKFKLKNCTQFDKYQ